MSDRRMDRLIRRLTHRIWNREISRLLCRAYERRHIDSTQLHILTAQFDPTQNHEVDRPYKAQEKDHE